VSGAKGADGAAVNAEVEASVEALGSGTKLARDRALGQMYVTSFSPRELADFVRQSQKVLGADHLEPEKEGLLRGLTKVVEEVTRRAAADGVPCSADMHALARLCIRLTSVTFDVRIRGGAGRLLGSTLAAIGALEGEAALVETYDALVGPLLETTREELAIEFGSDELRHDTEGWKALESHFLALQSAVSVLPVEPGTERVGILVPLLIEGTTHQNRFVRELSYQTLGVLAPHGAEYEEALLRGLADNWSQVRFAAAHATEAYFNVHQRLRPDLLPRIALNRHYVAEGVKLHATRLWQTISPRKLDIPAFLEYYKECGEADNHAVREAAARCVAELAAAVPARQIESHIDQCCAWLLDLFKDESWPVRDCACNASGIVLSRFPAQCRPYWNEFLDQWILHVRDNINSVRDNAAKAFGKVLVCDDAELAAMAKERALAELTKFLGSAKEQRSDSRAAAGLTNETKFGVAEKRAFDNDPHIHTGQTPMSCGSLAPKLKRGAGCMDHSFRRGAEPWEVSDGCVFLFRELVTCDPTQWPVFLPAVMELLTLRSFAHYSNLHTTILRTLRHLWPSMPADLRPTVLPAVHTETRDENRLVSSEAKFLLEDAGEEVLENVD
jgi:hypothetical protein